LCQTKFIWQNVWLTTTNFRLCDSGFIEHWVLIESLHVSLIVLHWHTRALRLGVQMLQDLTRTCKYVCSTHLAHSTATRLYVCKRDICTVPRAPSGKLVFHLWADSFKRPSPCSLVDVTVLWKSVLCFSCLTY
jgi:hypothetical protein